MSRNAKAICQACQHEEFQLIEHRIICANCYNEIESFEPDFINAIGKVILMINMEDYKDNDEQ